jgi:hypothetical protein
VRAGNGTRFPLAGYAQTARIRTQRTFVAHTTT